MDNNDTGILINGSNIKLHRKYFLEMVRLHGIQCLYRAPRESKTYNLYGELDSKYYEPIKVGCIFHEHPTQWTMKKLGWNSELSKESSLIEVPYDLEKLQVGALFIVPSDLDNAQGRVFRVISMSTNHIYPSSITCEIGPVFENEFQQESLNFSSENFNLLSDEEEDE